MKYYLISAGGCGVRGLESVLHLCAAGLGPDEIKVLLIDPDAANGNGTRTNGAYADYGACCGAFAGKLGAERFFSTEFSVLTGGESGGLQPWSPVNTASVFQDMLGFDLLTPLQQDVTKLMFTEAELQMPLNVGFRGHPALGAAALALLPLYRDDAVWKKVGSELSKDLSTGPVRVMIIGSVFGGTGASVFFPLARRLRELAGARIGQLKIAVTALAPYFTFPKVESPTDPGNGPDARKFPIATRAAAEFYHHLRATGAWPFEAMFWLGDDKPTEVVPHDGGEHQENKAHFIDFLAGLSCLDYFRQPLDVDLGGSCFFAGPDGDLAARENVTTWKDLPLSNFRRDEIRKQMLRFVMTGAVHLGFFSGPLEYPKSGLTEHPTAIPWYWDRFVKPGHRLDVPPHNASIAALTRFFVHQHFPWLQSIHSTAGGRVRLLNANSMLFQAGPPPQGTMDLRRLANLLYPDLGNPDLDAMHRFFCDTCAQGEPKSEQNAPTDGAPSYLATLAGAAAHFMEREYPTLREAYNAKNLPR
jgi:hypothetical protein